MTDLMTVLADQQQHRHHDHRQQEDRNVKQSKKKRPYLRNKIGLTQPRVTCTVCLKDGAVWYYGNKKHTSIIYEHRDEPAVSVYQYRGHQYPRYRRCSTGTFKDNPIDPMLETIRQEQQQQQQHDEKQQISEEGSSQEKQQGPDYKTLYFELKSKYDAIQRLLEGARSL